VRWAKALSAATWPPVPRLSSRPVPRARAEQFRRVLGDAATDRLHLRVHDYTTFDGAEKLAAQMELDLGGIDDVVAPVGGWWAGRRLWEIDEVDWASAFTGLATTHMAVLRACLPRMTAEGAYTVVVGSSASWPVPGSGLVSMEQAAVLMMQQVLVAELDGSKRVFALVLGQVNTRYVEAADPDWVTADQAGAIAVAASAATTVAGREIRVGGQAQVLEALTLFQTSMPAPTAN